MLRNEYLVAENRILRARLPSRLRLSDAERSTLAEIANRLGRKALKEIARSAQPDTILAWYQRLVAQKFNGSRRRSYPGRPRVSPEVEALAGGVTCVALPAHSPNLNCYAERWVRSVKSECVSKLILFGERSLRRALTEYVAHFHAERNHQGKGNVLLFPQDLAKRTTGSVQCRERLGGLLRYYDREAA